MTTSPVGMEAQVQTHYSSLYHLLFVIVVILYYCLLILVKLCLLWHGITCQCCFIIIFIIQENQHMKDMILYITRFLMF